jgi:hypothetical protein
MPSLSRIIIDSLISPIAAIESSGYGFSSGVDKAPTSRPAPSNRNDKNASTTGFVPRQSYKAKPATTTKPTTTRLFRGRFTRRSLQLRQSLLLLCLVRERLLQILWLRLRRRVRLVRLLVIMRILCLRIVRCVLVRLL